MNASTIILVLIKLRLLPLKVEGEEIKFSLGFIFWSIAIFGSIGVCTWSWWSLVPTSSDKVLWLVLNVNMLGSGGLFLFIIGKNLCH